MVTETNNGIRYDYNEQIGRGSYGDVYKGTATRISDGSTTPVAIKILRGHTPYNLFSETAYLQLFSKNRVICEKYVACLRDVYFVNRIPRLVYDFVNGANFETIINNDNDHINKQNSTVAIHLISGLNYFFRLGVYHLDIKPANIVMDQTTHLPKFVDWGGACFTRKLTSLLEGKPFDPRFYIDRIEEEYDETLVQNSSTTAGHNNCVYGGTPIYAPPETMTLNYLRTFYVENKERNFRPAANALLAVKRIVSEHVTLFENNLGKLHDIWSLGVTLLEWYGEDFSYLYNIVLYEKNQEEINEIINYSIPDNDFIRLLLKLMLTIDTADRLINWTTVVTLVESYCLEHDDNRGCPTTAENENINSFIRDAHSTSVENWYAADIDPLELRSTEQYNRITLDIAPSKRKIIDELVS